MQTASDSGDLSASACYRRAYRKAKEILPNRSDPFANGSECAPPRSEPAAPWSDRVTKRSDSFAMWSDSFTPLSGRVTNRSERFTPISEAVAPLREFTIPLIVRRLMRSLLSGRHLVWLVGRRRFVEFSKYQIYLAQAIYDIFDVRGE